MTKGKECNYIIATERRSKFKIFIFTLLFVAIILSVQFAAAYANPATVNLGTSSDFVILAETKISTTGTTSIVGDIGISPAAASFITGFGLSAPPTTFTTSPLVTGKVYAYNYDVPTPAKMNTAINDMHTAYTNAAGRISDETGRGAGTLNGETFVRGVYKWTSPVTITGDIYLSGSASDVWIFQIDQTFNIQAGKKVILIGGAQAQNVFWQIAGETTLYPNSVFNGIILDQTGIAMQNGATLNGRALAQSAVTLIANSVSLTVPTGLPILTTIILSPQLANLTIGSTLQLNVTSLDQFGLPIVADISYNSSNSSIVIVNATSGLVTPVAPGSATITATSGNVSTTSVINVQTASHKTIPVMNDNLFILLIISTLVLGLYYGFKKYSR
jgi:hypothetical protein